MRTLYLLVLILPAFLFAAPVPKSAAPLPPFPRTVGDTRVYEWRTGDKAEEGYTDEVTHSEAQKDESTHVTIRRTDAQKRVTKFIIGVATTGLTRIAVDDRPLDEPYVLLKLPAAIGTKWSADGAAHEVTAEEEVTVAAGKYQTVKVEMTVGTGKTTLWFAPAVGLVRMTSGEGGKVLELKSFKSGND